VWYLCMVKVKRGKDRTDNDRGNQRHKIRMLNVLRVLKPQQRPRGPIWAKVVF